MTIDYPSPTRAGSYLVAIIHNYDPYRNQQLEAELSRLMSEKPVAAEIKMAWVGYQPKLSPLKAHLRISRWLAQKNLSAKLICRLYRTGRLKRLLWWAISWPLDLWSIYSSARMSSLKASIEMQLTKKHMRAWEHFLDSEASFLIVLEDDARLNDHFISNVADLIHSASLGSSPFIVSLCRDYELGELGIAQDISFFGERYIRFMTGAMNTTAGYVLNRSAACLFLEGIDNDPRMKLLNSDFLINCLLLKNSPKVSCLHAMNALVTNSSVSGDTQTSIKG